MVLGRRGFGTLFLTVAGVLFCLLALSATSSEAQERTEARNGGTSPVTGDDECVELQDENTRTGTGGDTGTDTDGNNTTTDTGEDTITDTGGDIGNQRIQQNENTGDRQAQQNGNTGGQQAQQNENGGNGGDPQASQDRQDNTTSSGTEGTGGEECIIEDTVPDKSLPPTGASVNPQAETTAAEKEQKRSDRGGKPESQGEKQQKSDQGKKPENSSEEQRKPDRGVKKLEIKDRGNKVEIEDRSGKKSCQERLGPHSKSASTPDPTPKLAASWPRPTRTEVASAGKPRRFAPSPGSEMTLSAKALGVYNAPIKSSGRPEDLDNGLIRVPETSLPWDRGAQRNVYVAGHYLAEPLPGEAVERLLVEGVS